MIMIWTTSIQAPQSKASSPFPLSLKGVGFVWTCHTAQLWLHTTVSKVNCGHKAWASMLDNEASSAGIPPSLERLVLFVTWKGSTLMGYISSTISKVAVPPFGASKSAEPLAHQSYWFCTLASQIPYKTQVTDRSHGLFPLTADLETIKKKAMGLSGFFLGYTAATLKWGHHLTLKDSE